MAQDFRPLRISPDMTVFPPRLIAFESVCCLDCGKEYAKPADGGTLTTNPGCPYCGYVGWLPIAASLRTPWRRDRSVADRRRRPFAPAG